jgi:hypothetical protein
VLIHAHQLTLFGGGCNYFLLFCQQIGTQRAALKPFLGFGNYELINTPIANPAVLESVMLPTPCQCLRTFAASL